MIKRLLFILLLAFLGMNAASAQNPKGDKHRQMMEELQEFKMKFLAQEMELKDDQKERFFTLYKEMSEKRRNCMREAWRLEKKVKKSSDATEADYEAAAEAMNKAKAEDARIEKEYDDKFSEFLTQKQIFKMKDAENAFRKKMQEMKHQRRRHK